MPDIKLTFKGADFTISEANAFEVGEMVEEIAIIPEVLGWLQKPKFHKMSRCMGVMLRFAGCRASDKEIHSEMMSGFIAGGAQAHLASLFALIGVLMDGLPANEGGSTSEKPEAS
jgi:hypothetical protein